MRKSNGSLRNLSLGLRCFWTTSRHFEDSS